MENRRNQLERVNRPNRHEKKSNSIQATHVLKPERKKLQRRGAGREGNKRGAYNQFGGIDQIATVKPWAW